jgi:hypothetical protein
MRVYVNAFGSKQEVLDAFQAARQAQEDMCKAWFAVRDGDSDESELARIAYTDANLEVNRLIEIYNNFHRQR